MNEEGWQDVRKGMKYFTYVLYTTRQPLMGYVNVQVGIGK